MHAYLITSGSASDRVEAINKRLTDLHIAATDIIYLNDENDRIGIDSVRAFRKQLVLSPYLSPFVAGVILQAERLTQEAQNALLKVLEEPPPRVLFFVETSSLNSLLPTIVSRLTRLTGDTPIAILEADEECQRTIEQLLSSSPGKTLAIIETIASDRLASKKWLQTAMITSRALLLQKIENAQDPAGIKRIHLLIRNLLKAQEELELNINPKLVLDTVFLSLNRTQSVSP